MLKFFQDKREVVAIMSEKSEGSMRIFKSGKNDKNREDFFKNNKIHNNILFSAEIVHSNKVALVNKNSPKLIEGVDALVSKDNIFLSVTVADCIPVYFYDEKNKVIAIAHAGWRGIVNGIVGNVVDKMLEIGGDINNIKIAIGPGLRVCHFEIREDILDDFSRWIEYVIKRDNKIFVDIFGIIKKELFNKGIVDLDIFDSGRCTFCNEASYFSYRRDKPGEIEAMIAVIGLK